MSIKELPKILGVSLVITIVIVLVGMLPPKIHIIVDWVLIGLSVTLTLLWVFWDRISEFKLKRDLLVVRFLTLNSKFVTNGLIPPDDLEFLLGIGKPNKSSSIIEILSRRNDRLCISIVCLHPVVAKVIPGFIPTGRLAAPSSKVDFDRGTGTKVMRYYRNFFGFEVDLLQVNVTWREDSPIFFFTGLFRKGAAKAWNKYQKELEESANKYRK